jgi:hypothetical protein
MVGGVVGEFEVVAAVWSGGMSMRRGLRACSDGGRCGLGWWQCSSRWWRWRGLGVCGEGVVGEYVGSGGGLV